MSNRFHNEISAYIATPDIDALSAAVSKLCLEEGMRPAEAIPIPTFCNSDSERNNYWSIYIFPARQGWHLILSLPEELLCRISKKTGKLRFIRLCEALGAPGLLLETNEIDDQDDEVAFANGQVAVETDGHGRHAISGHMYREAAKGDSDLTDGHGRYFKQPGDLMDWYGCTVPEEEQSALKPRPRVLESILPPEDTQIGMYSSENCFSELCMGYARRLAGPMAKFWQTEFGWKWLLEAFRYDEPLPETGGKVLHFSWPANDRPNTEARREERQESSEYFYSDGHEIRWGDRVRFVTGGEGIVHWCGGFRPRVMLGPKIIEERNANGDVVWTYGPDDSVEIDDDNVGNLEYVGPSPYSECADSIDVLRSQARSGDAEAMFRLGKIFGKGRVGVPANPLVSALWFERAARLGHAEAQFQSYGIADSGNQGVSPDWTLGANWLRSAAAQGHFLAMRNLAMHYRSGNPLLKIPKDQEESVRWRMRAADLGNQEEQLILACMFHEGSGGVTKDAEKAMAWVTRAGQLGNRSAQYLLGNCYQHGECVDTDAKVALYWYTRAAEQGHRQAIQRLAELRPMDKMT